MTGEFSRGWRPLAAATLGVSMATTAIPFYSLGVFVAPLGEARGWSRTDISLAATLFGFSLPLSMLTLGYFIDRHGARLVATSGHLMLGLAFIALSFVGESIWMFWGIYVAAAFLAAGASPITFTRVVIAFFNRRRGLALGICMSGAGLGAALAPPLLASVIDTYGWAAAYRVLGLLVLCLAPVALFWLIDKPAKAARPRATPEAPAHALALPGNPAILLGIICVAFFAIAASVNGYIVHLIPLLIDAGVTPTRAAWIGGFVGVSVIVGRLSVGSLLDKVPVGLLAMTVFSLAAFGIVLLAFVGAPAAIVTALLIGVTIGAEVDLVAYLVSRGFRQEDYARYFSRVYSAFMLGSGLSPLVAGWIYDRNGTYGPFLWLSCLVLVVVSAAFLALHLAQRPRSRAGSFS